MRKSRLSWSKQCRLIELFVAGATVRTAAALAGVNRNTVRHYFHRLREVIMAIASNAACLPARVC